MTQKVMKIETEPKIETLWVRFSTYPGNSFYSFFHTFHKKWLEKDKSMQQLSSRVFEEWGYSYFLLFQSPYFLQFLCSLTLPNITYPAGAKLHFSFKSPDFLCVPKLSWVRWIVVRLGKLSSNQYGFHTPDGMKYEPVFCRKYETVFL